MWPPPELLDQTFLEVGPDGRDALELCGLDPPLEPEVGPEAAVAGAPLDSQPAMDLGEAVELPGSLEAVESVRVVAFDPQLLEALASEGSLRCSSLRLMLLALRQGHGHLMLNDRRVQSLMLGVLSTTLSEFVQPCSV